MYGVSFLRGVLGFEVLLKQSEKTLIDGANQKDKVSKTRQPNGGKKY